MPTAFFPHPTRRPDARGWTCYVWPPAGGTRRKSLETFLLPPKNAFLGLKKIKVPNLTLPNLRGDTFVFFHFHDSLWDFGDLWIELRISFEGCHVFSAETTHSWIKHARRSCMSPYFFLTATTDQAARRLEVKWLQIIERPGQLGDGEIIWGMSCRSEKKTYPNAQCMLYIPTFYPLNYPNGGFK